MKRSHFHPLLSLFSPLCSCVQLAVATLQLSPPPQRTIVGRKSGIVFHAPCVFEHAHHTSPCAMLQASPNVGRSRFQGTMINPMILQ
ncbi:hypothetical protein B0O80DRAFT_92734 [Mortierella sp. GBAus27b]|nr:hypothetical protein B0O80DRAFT_92734 [Mortierella sp. GBAus27b]